jgi:hypothetical protein
MLSYPRRQQYRRLSKAGAAAAGSATAVLTALVVASTGAVSIAGVLAVAAVALGLNACRWLRLAGRSRIGARSEDEVRRVLAPLQAEGWRLRHSAPWRGRGDIDSVAIAPSGVGFAIETKTRTYDSRHLAVVQQQAAWLWRRRRRWCRLGAMPVLCVVRAAGIQRWERGVLVVSLEALIPTLRHAAAEAHHPLPSIDR